MAVLVATAVGYGKGGAVAALGFKYIYCTGGVCGVAVPKVPGEAGDALYTGAGCAIKGCFYTCGSSMGLA